MYYYKYNHKLLFSKFPIEDLETSLEADIINGDNLYFLTKMDPLRSRRGFLITSPSQLEASREDLNILVSDDSNSSTQWLDEKIKNGKVKAINISYPNWKDELSAPPIKWRINVMALGDVGSNLSIGLRLSQVNMEIGIFDRNPEKLQRWNYELNQIRIPFKEQALPKVRMLSEDELFDCDMFVFCASKGIPPVGMENVDVRMVQFEGNREIISKYGRLAREKGFKGIFAVVSDPVDPLCKALFLESNKDVSGNMDYKGLAPNQIIGYGLGVMNARATFYSELNGTINEYSRDGQVFGPHGKGLIVVNSISNYKKALSDYLTEKTLNANLEVRKLGFKPYIAPSLSSGALSIVATINGDYFYGSSLMGDVFIGSKMRLTKLGLEIPRYKLDDDIICKLNDTYNGLRSII